MRRSSNPAALAWALVIGHEARATEADEREVRAMAESNFHGEIMNIRCVSAMAGDVTAYKEGHRDARHAAAEIANEADARIASLEAQLAAAQERERALREGFTACIDTLWRYTRLAARERGESETEQLMSANEAVGHFRAALAAQ